MMPMLRCFGLKLAVAFCDGRVVILAPELPFRPEVWVVEGTLPVPGGLDVTGASWRSSLPGKDLGHIVIVGPSQNCIMTGRKTAQAYEMNSRICRLQVKKIMFALEQVNQKPFV